MYFLYPEKKSILLKKNIQKNLRFRIVSAAHLKCDDPCVFVIQRGENVMRIGTDVGCKRKEKKNHGCIKGLISSVGPLLGPIFSNKWFYVSHLKPTLNSHFYSIHVFKNL